jgi:hypothetical protein
VFTIAESPDGKIVRDEETNSIYLLTPCCNATAKGSSAGGVGMTVCRSCYIEIDTVYGCSWPAEQAEAVIEQRFNATRTPGYLDELITKAAATSPSTSTRKETN